VGIVAYYCDCGRLKVYAGALTFTSGSGDLFRRLYRQKVRLRTSRFEMRLVVLDSRGKERMVWKGREGAEVREAVRIALVSDVLDS
jgi:hypothetical protein